MQRVAILNIASGVGVGLLFFVLQFTVNVMSREIQIIVYTIAGLLIVVGIIGLRVGWGKLINFMWIKLCRKSKKWVTCDKCGLIGVRNIKTRELEEMEDNQRKTGQIVKIQVNSLGDTEPRHEEIPECILQAQDFAVIPFLSTHSLPLYHMQFPRQCEYFMTWEKGATPKEHKEKIDKQQGKAII